MWQTRRETCDRAFGQRDSVPDPPQWGLVPIIKRSEELGTDRIHLYGKSRLFNCEVVKSRQRTGVKSCEHSSIHIDTIDRTSYRKSGDRSVR